MRGKVNPRVHAQFYIVLTCLALSMPQVESANIVFYFGLSTYSHRVPAWPLAEALAEKGHRVTFISPYPAKNPNPKIFDYSPTKLKEWLDSWDDLDDVFQNRKNNDLTKDWTSLPDFGIMVCNQLYSDDEYVNWVKTTKVDLVFIDALSNDCAYGMAHYWTAKTIIFDTTTIFAWYVDGLGMPDETTWIPNMELFYPADMTFWQRIKNALVPIAWNIYRSWKFFPVLEDITRKGLGISDVPSFAAFEKNTSLIFVNTHYGEEFARSFPPNAIPIGGIAWEEKRKPLPKNLDEFLKKGNGFVYVSFGTYADFTKMDIPIQQAFIKTFNNMPEIQFVWKVANDSLINEFPGKNVYISKWMPQQDILGHPKVRAFITHSGLLGIQEAIHNVVPLISFPVSAEQDYNAERIHRKEYGIRLEIIDVTQPQLEDAVRRVLKDPKYRNNMKKISEMFLERPQKPLETALWWTDYVLRHDQEHLSALRPMTALQPWWKRRQLDVWGTIAGSILAFFILTMYLLIKIVKACMCASATTQPSKSQLRKKLR